MSDNHQEFISKEDNSGTLALPDDFLPDQLHILPVNGRPFFPAQVQPIMISEEIWGDTLRQVADSESKLLGVAFVNEKVPTRFRSWVIFPW